MLSQAEKEQALCDVRDLILGSGQTAVLLRPTGKSLYGSDDLNVEDVGTIAAELVETPPIDLVKNVDAVAHLLPEAEVHVTDRLRFGNEVYRIQAVKPEIMFGAKTHQVAKLVLMKGKS